MSYVKKNFLGWKYVTKAGMVEISYNPSTCEVETGRLGIQGYSWLYVEFETSLGDVRQMSQSTVVLPNFSPQGQAPR